MIEQMVVGSRDISIEVLSSVVTTHRYKSYEMHDDNLDLMTIQLNLPDCTIPYILNIQESTAQGCWKLDLIL